MATAGDSLSALFARLRKCKPRKLRVRCADGEEREVEVPAHRNRWKALEGILRELEWVRVEAQNSKGSVLDIIENADYEPADEIDQPFNIVDDGGNRVADVAVIAAQLVTVMLRAQDVALKRRTDDTRLCIDAQRQTIDLLVTRLTNLERFYGENASKVHELTRALADGANGDESGAALAVLAQVLTQGKAPPNGVPG